MAIPVIVVTLPMFSIYDNSSVGYKTPNNSQEVTIYGEDSSTSRSTGTTWRSLVSPQKCVFYEIVLTILSLSTSNYLSTKTLKKIKVKSEPPSSNEDKQPK